MSVEWGKHETRSQEQWCTKEARRGPEGAPTMARRGVLSLTLWGFAIISMFFTDRAAPYLPHLGQPVPTPRYTTAQETWPLRPFLLPIVCVILDKALDMSGS